MSRATVASRLKRHVLALSGVVAANVVPLVGILLLGWSLLEVVAYAWLEAVVIVVFAALRTPFTARAWALLLAPAYLVAMGVLLLFALLLLTLAFFVMRFQDDFWGTIAEGERVVRGLLWGAVILVAWHAVALALDVRAGLRSTLRALGRPTLHALTLVFFSVVAVYIVRDLSAPALALGLFVLAKIALDVALYAPDTAVTERWLGQ